MRRIAAALLTVALVAWPIAPVDATPRWTANQGQLDRTIAYLQQAQNPDGGFGASAGAASDPLFTAWVAIALAAGGVNPQDQRTPGGTDAYTYLTAHAADLELTTDDERAMLAAIAAGADPRAFGGRDLVAAILSRQHANGSFAHAAGGADEGINDTAFAMLPLSALGDATVTPALQRAAAWLPTVQGADGGWAWAAGQQESSDITAAVIEALHVVARSNTTEGIAQATAEAKGWSYLHTTQHADGGFGQDPGDAVSNTASTAWVVQAMWAAGIDPTTWLVAGRSPLDFLASLQQPDGSISYQPGHSENDLWMTAYAAPALAGYPLPVPSVPRATTVVDPPTADAGVTSGGGGDGAPLFSRPQPQSGGHASGGVRRVATGRPKAKATKKTKRAPGARHATGTAQSNGAARRGVTPDATTAKESRGAKTERLPRAAGRGAKEPHSAKTEPASRGAGPGATGVAPPARGARSAVGDQDVTGHLLTTPTADAASTAGVSGTGDQTGVAPGLRTARSTDGSPTTALLLAALLLAAALAGATLEAHHGRKPLLP